MKPRMLSLCSGIGGIDLAAEWAGFEIAGQVEIDEYCRQVLAKHWPTVPRRNDIHEIQGDEFGDIDLIAGGIPCQPFSVAGKRRGKEDDRHLWPAMLRIIERARPTWVLIENVANFVSMALDDVLADLESQDYEARTFVFPACAVGAPHRRDRVFVVAYAASIGTREQSCQAFADAYQRYAWMGPGRSNGRQPIIAAYPSMANANSAECKTRRSNSMGNREQTKSFACPGGNVANSDRQGLAVREIFGSNASAQFAATQRGCGTRTTLWSVEPDVGRVAHGIPCRVDRLRSLGNAVVPQQVYPILASIATIYKTMAA